MVYYLWHQKEGVMKKQYFEIKDEAPTSDVIDLSTMYTGADFFIEYYDMVRTIRNRGIDYAKKHDPLLKKFSQFGRG